VGLCLYQNAGPISTTNTCQLQVVGVGKGGHLNTRSSMICRPIRPVIKSQFIQYSSCQPQKSKLKIPTSKINLVLLKCEVSHFAFGVSFMIWCTNQVVFISLTIAHQYGWGWNYITTSCLVCRSPDPPLVSCWAQD